MHMSRVTAINIEYFILFLSKLSNTSCGILKCVYQAEKEQVVRVFGDISQKAHYF